MQLARRRAGSTYYGLIILLKTHSHMPVETKLKDGNTDNIVYGVTLTSEERQVKKTTTYHYISLR